MRRLSKVGLSNPFMQFVSRIENAALQNRARERPGIALTEAVPSVDESNKKTADFVMQRWLFCETLQDEDLSCCNLGATTRPQFNYGIPAMRSIICR
jgi:hypothetical protein